MARHVAFLRAVNLGSRNRIKMATLRELVESLGYEDVATHLQSGNVLFRSPGTTPAKAAKAIEDALAAQLDVTAPVIVRTRAELAAVVEANPLQDVATDPARHLVTFLSAKPDVKARAALAAIDAAAYEPDVFAVEAREIHAWFPDGVQRSKLTNAFWEKRLGVTGTARNWKTVTKLLELAGV